MEERYCLSDISRERFTLRRVKHQITEDIPDAYQRICNDAYQMTKWSSYGVPRLLLPHIKSLSNYYKTDY